MRSIQADHLGQSVLQVFPSTFNFMLVFPRLLNSISGWIFQKVSAEIGQKGPHFVTKTPNFNSRRNFGLPAPKLMRFFQKTGNWKIPQVFHVLARFFSAHKTQLKGCPIILIHLVLLYQILVEKHATFTCRFRSNLSLVHTREISTSTNARHTHAKNQSPTNQTISARAYAWHLCLSCAYLTSVNQA